MSDEAAVTVHGLLLVLAVGAGHALDAVAVRFVPPPRWPRTVFVTAVVLAVAAAGVPALLRGGAARPAAVVAVALAYATFAAVSVLLARIDIRTHRLPDAVVLPALAASVLLLALASALQGDPLRALGVVGGAAALFAFYLVLRVVSPRGMGGGDVKLAAVVGAHLGFLGGAELVVGALAGFLLGGAAGIVALVRRSRRAVPFGPWMLAGAWLVLLAVPPFA